MLKILDCMYFCTVMLSTQYSIGAYQTFNVTRVELIRIRHIPETRRALSMLHAACLKYFNVHQAYRTHMYEVCGHLG